MATPWERIDTSDNGQSFKTWLTNRQISPDEFNGASLVDRSTLRTQFDQQQRQQQQLADSWYLVTGAISRPTSHAGARYSLFRFASSDGFYPQGCDANTAFEVIPSPREGDESNILKFSIIFQTLTAAAKFVDNAGSYLRDTRRMLEFCDKEGNRVAQPSITPVAPYRITPESKILWMHYCASRDGDGAPDSPVIDMVIGSRSINSEDTTVDVTILTESDEVFRYQRIENSTAFALADPEAAHIVPRAKCVGRYEWLNDKPFNRLALSRDLHLNFDGTAPGRGKTKRPKTAQTFAIRPLRNQAGYSISQIHGIDCYEIQLEIVINDNTKAEALLAHLQNHAQLNRNENKRWTITGADVRVFYPRNRRVDLILEADDHHAANLPQVLVTAIPGIHDLSDCWSNSPQNRLSVEAAEVLEKCLYWNYEQALLTWSMLG